MFRLTTCSYILYLYVVNKKSRSEFPPIEGNPIYRTGRIPYESLLSSLSNILQPPVVSNMQIETFRQNCSNLSDYQGFSLIYSGIHKLNSASNQSGSETKVAKSPAFPRLSDTPQ